MWTISFKTCYLAPREKREIRESNKQRQTPKDKVRATEKDEQIKRSRNLNIERRSKLKENLSKSLKFSQ